jgi:basic membrane protein A
MLTTSYPRFAGDTIGTFMEPIATGIAACAPPAQESGSPRKIRVGLVTDTGGVKDKSFNQSAWSGVQKAVRDLGVEARFIESKQPTDYEKNIDQFATEKYDAIISVGITPTKAPLRE